MANLRMTLLDLLNKSEQGADPNDAVLLQLCKTLRQYGGPDTWQASLQVCEALGARKEFTDDSGRRGGPKH